MTTLIPEFDLKQLEIWKPMPNMEAEYLISTLGRIKGLQSNRRYKPGRILRYTPNNKGYHMVSLVKNKSQKTYTVHRLVALSFLVKPPNDTYQVNHINGNKTDNRVCNLEWVVASENLKHAFALGLSDQKGENNGCAKLTESDVIEIRALLTKGLSQKAIAEQFHVSRSNIGAIKAGKSWKHRFELVAQE